MYELLVLMEKADINILIALYFAYLLFVCLVLYLYDKSGWRGRLARLTAIIITAVSCYYGVIIFFCL